METTELDEDLLIIILSLKTSREQLLKCFHKPAAIRRFKDVMSNFVHASEPLTPDTLITVQKNPAFMVNVLVISITGIIHLNSFCGSQC